MNATATTKVEEEELDPSIAFDSLIFLNMEATIKNSMLPNILSTKMWKFCAKVLYKEINVQFSNYDKWKKLF